MDRSLRAYCATFRMTSVDGAGKIRDVEDRECYGTALLIFQSFFLLLFEVALFGDLAQGDMFEVSEE
jgi:hypothetical protein